MDKDTNGSMLQTEVQRQEYSITENFKVTVSGQ
jgi:hypothetical protein